MRQIITKRVLQIIYGLLFISLTACSGLSAGGEIREQEFEAIEVESWPAPEVEPSPTPTREFVRIDLPTATPEVAEVEVALSPDSNEADGVFSLPTESEILKRIVTEFPVVSVAAIKVPETIVRAGPALNYGQNETLLQGDLAGVYGRDPSGQWIYVLTASRSFGWIPYSDVYALDTLDEAPVLPPDPINFVLEQALGPQAAALINAQRTGSTGQVTQASASAPQPLETANFDPVAEALVTSSLLPIRQRPGAVYNQIGSLSSGDTLSVLAVNRDREWALISAETGEFGWVSVDFLDITGSLADAPQVRTLDPVEDDAAAPIVSLSGSGGATTASAVASTSGSPQPSVAGGQPAGEAVAISGVDFTPEVVGNTLGVKSSGSANIKVELRRGPGESFGTVDELTVGDFVAVRGVNDARDWVLVQAEDSGGVGWVPLSTLDSVGSFGGAVPVVSGWIVNNGLVLRTGPGIVYDVVGPVSINDFVSILALNGNQDWIFIETLAGGQGWIPRIQLDVTGDLSNVPAFTPPTIAAAGGNAPLPVASTGVPLTGQLVLQRSSGQDVLVINSDGTGLRELTTGIDPALSPDGQRVAFTRWTGDTGNLYVVDIDGSNEQVIAENLVKAKGPEWSPDGSQIVFNYQQGGRPEESEKCQDADRNIPNGAIDLRFIPPGPDNDEPRVCFTLLPDPHWTLRLVTLADGSFIDIDGGTYAFRPAWDPANTWRVVSEGGRGLLAVDVNRPEFRETLSVESNDSSPVFSPDGQYLILTSGKPGSNQGFEIFRMNADGSGRARLTETPFWVPLQPETEGVQWNNVAPTWSPDGQQIAFLTDRNGLWEIWLMNIDGSNQRPMFSDEVNAELNITYNFVDERVISWR